MTQERGLLIDYENVQKIDLSRLADDWRVTIFVGASQKSIPFELVQGAQHLGAQVDWIKVEGSGNNALDFYIAYYLGCEFTRSPQAQYIILSNDTGFDPLIRHLKSKGFCCRRISALTELDMPERIVPDKCESRPRKQARPGELGKTPPLTTTRSAASNGFWILSRVTPRATFLAFGSGMKNSIPRPLTRQGFEPRFSPVTISERGLQGC
jgi:hypothetical protein